MKPDRPEPLMCHTGPLHLRAKRRPRPHQFLGSQGKRRYALGVALAWVSPRISYGLYVAVAVAWFVPGRRFAKDVPA